MTEYDKYYKTRDLFGEPYPELIDFFKQYEPKGSVIDLGCGQGRDAIALARLGYKVTGIDSSKIGIDQMISTSEREGLCIIGIVGDIFLFENYHDFDIVLLDSMFHFEKRDIIRETAIIEKIARRLKKDGVICFCIQNTGKKVKILKETIANQAFDFDTLNDSILIYSYEDKESGHKSETEYCMYVVKKR